VTARTIVDQALGALRGIALPDDVAKTTRDAADEIERAWQRRPLTAGLEGNLVARSELVNLLAGERVLDPFRRALGSPPLRLRRGAGVRFRIVRTDGTVEDRPPPEPESRDGDADLERHAGETRTELARQETALVAIERELPTVVRKRPAVWAIWLWPLRWLFALLHRNATVTWRATQRAIADAEHDLSGIQRVFTDREEREKAARETYYGELRVLCGGGAASADIRAIEVLLPALPDEVELVELMGELRAAAEIDAVIVVERDALYAPSPGGERVQLGPAQQTVADLPEQLAGARALTLARRARDKLGSLRATVEVEIDRAERDFRERLRRVSKLALPIDTTRYAAEQLARVKPMIVASVNAVMEHASTHLGSELAQLGATWMTAVSKATSGKELEAAIALVEEQWPAQARRIAEEVRMLVMGGAGGIARDLYTDTVSPLAAHGLPEEHMRVKRAPEITPVLLLPSLTNPTTFTVGGNWFTGLFRSFDARKTDLREKVHARIERIKEVSAAEMLDAEPKLHTAVSQALATHLDAAIELQRGWHEKAIAEEQAAIAQDRELLAPLTRSRDAITSAAYQIAKLADALAAERPAVAAAAVAAAS
jgi:hypothetical protein